MKRIIAGLAIVGALGACSADSIGSEPRVSAPVPAAPVVSQAQQFRTIMDERGASEAYIGSTDAEIDSAGEAVCTVVTQQGQAGANAVIRGMVSEGYSADLSITMLVGLVYVYCQPIGDALWGSESASGGYTTA